MKCSYLHRKIIFSTSNPHGMEMGWRGQFTKNFVRNKTMCPYLCRKVFFPILHSWQVGVMWEDFSKSILLNSEWNVQIHNPPSSCQFTKKLLLRNYMKCAELHIKLIFSNSTHGPREGVCRTKSYVHDGNSIEWPELQKTHVFYFPPSQGFGLHSLTNTLFDIAWDDQNSMGI